MRWILNSVPCLLASCAPIGGCDPIACTYDDVAAFDLSSRYDAWRAEQEVAYAFEVGFDGTLVVRKRAQGTARHASSGAPTSTGEHPGAGSQSL